MKRLVTIFSTVCVISLNAQVDINGGPTNVPVEGVIDGVVMKEIIPTKRMIPYEFVREADMMWSKRIHRYIDKREKQNLTLFYPLDERNDGLDGQENWIKNASRYSLWTIIRENIMKGNLSVYYPMNPLFEQVKDGDQLKYPLAVKRNTSVPFWSDSAFFKELMQWQMFGSEDKSTRGRYLKTWDGMDDSIDPITNDYIALPSDYFYYTSADIARYDVKEDWFFDKERSVLDVRIIAIAPVLYDRDINTYRDLFWLYFPECRFVFNNYYTYNTKNDSQWMSFDDYFWKRQFTSTIYKQSDVFDRKIEDYRYGVDALLESQKITEEVRTFENNLWHF